MPLHIWSDEGIQKFADYFHQVAHLCAKSPELTARIAESCGRVIKLKQTKLFLTADSLEQRQETVKRIVGNTRHRTFEQQTAAKAITLFKNTKNTLPWVTNTQDKILIISANNIIAQIAVDALTSLGYTNINLQLTTDADAETLTGEISLSDKALVLTYNLAKSDEKLKHIMNRFNHFHKPYVMFSCRNPYDIMHVPDANTNVLVYGVSGMDQTNYQMRNFNLNLTQAVIKVMTAGSLNDFNQHCPVSMEVKKPDPRGEW